MPTLKDMVAMLICDDVQESIEFYTSVLGFTVANRMDTVGSTGWASLRNGSVQLMLASPGYLPAPQKSEGRCSQAMYYFYPEDVESLHGEIHQSGLAATDLTTRFYGMREFELPPKSKHLRI